MKDLNLSDVYNESLEAYQNSVQYQRELALNCVNGVIPIFEDSPYYSLGLRGIESEFVSYYKLYIDVSFIFSEYCTSYGLNVLFYVVSNDLGIRDKDIVYNSTLFFMIDMSSFHYILNTKSSYPFKYITLLNLAESNINLKYTKNQLCLYLHSNSVPFEDDIKILNYLLRFVDVNDFELYIFGSLGPEDTLRYLNMLFSYIPVCSVLIEYNFLRSSKLSLGDDWELEVESAFKNKVSHVACSPILLEEYSYDYIDTQRVPTIKSFRVINKDNSWYIGAYLY